jgi:hypothetical protein
MPIMLMSLMHRLECIVYRVLVKRFQAAGDVERFSRAKQRLKTAMLEMDGLIGRVIVEERFLQMPPRFTGAVFAVLALRIESALGPTESEISKIMAHTYIRQSLLFLRHIRQQDIPPMDGFLRGKYIQAHRLA